MTEPRTEAGKRLDEEWYPGGGDGLDVSEHAEFTASILAIEAEATAAAEQRLSDFERVAAKARILASYPLVGAEDARQDLIDALRDVWPPNRAWSASPRQGEPVADRTALRLLAAWRDASLNDDSSALYDLTNTTTAYLADRALSTDPAEPVAPDKEGNG